MKVVLGTLIKYDLLGEIAELVSALNELKKQIALLRKTMHKEHQSYIEFLSAFKKQIYQRLPKTIKKYFTDQSFLLFGYLVEKITGVEISEDDIKNLVMPKEKIEAIKKQIIALRDENISRDLKSFYLELMQHVLVLVVGVILLCGRIMLIIIAEFV